MFNWFSSGPFRNNTEQKMAIEKQEEIQQIDQVIASEISHASTSNVSQARVASTFKDVIGVTDGRQLAEKIEAARKAALRPPGLFNAVITNKIIKIQRAPEIMRRNGDSNEHFKPRELSIGPIHAADPDLFKTELKLKLAAHFISVNIRASEAEMHGLTTKLVDVNLIQTFAQYSFKMYFDKEVIKSYTDEELTWLLFLDGCAMLGFIDSYVQQKLNRFSISNGQAALIQHDLFLLENQIPLVVLELLIEVVCKQQSLCNRFYFNLKVFIHMNNTTFPRDFGESIPNEDVIPKGGRKPIHLLDFLRRELLVAPRDSDDTSSNPRGRTCNFFSHLCRRRVTAALKCQDEEMEDSNKIDELPGDQIKKPFGRNLLARTCNFFSLGVVALKCRRDQEREPSNKSDKLPEYRIKKHSFRNTQELQAAGIKFKPADSLRDISFHSKFCNITGLLELPSLVLDKWTPHVLLNLAAYEMCLENAQNNPRFDFSAYPDGLNKCWITSYVNLMDLLVDNEQDVKDLRAAGILRNCLSSDSEAAQWINKIGSYSFIPTMDMYENVKDRIASHCRRWSSIWMAEFCRTYFSSPWTIMALVAAIVVLGLTIAQTYYAVNPKS